MSVYPFAPPLPPALQSVVPHEAKQISLLKAEKTNLTEYSESWRDWHRGIEERLTSGLSDRAYFELINNEMSRLSNVIEESTSSFIQDVFEQLKDTPFDAATGISFAAYQARFREAYQWRDFFASELFDDWIIHFESENACFYGKFLDPGSLLKYSQELWEIGCELASFLFRISSILDPALARRVASSAKRTLPLLLTCKKALGQLSILNLVAFDARETLKVEQGRERRARAAKSIRSLKDQNKLYISQNRELLARLNPDYPEPASEGHWTVKIIASFLNKRPARVGARVRLLASKPPSKHVVAIPEGKQGQRQTFTKAQMMRIVNYLRPA